MFNSNEELVNLEDAIHKYLKNNLSIELTQVESLDFYGTYYKEYLTLKLKEEVISQHQLRNYYPK